MNLWEILEDKQKQEGGSISWLPLNDITTERKSELLEIFSGEKYPFLKGAQGMKRAEFYVGHCGLRIPGDTERTGMPEPIQCPRSGAKKLVVVSEPRRDSQLWSP